MSTFLFDDTIFGPVNSRRFGLSLGINLLSTHYKVCNFDCVYCECGFTIPKNADGKKFIPLEQLTKELEKRCKAGKEEHIDAITYAGNGEPTLHPQFDLIAKKVFSLRNQFYPKAKIILLTNGTTLHKKRVQKALPWIDEIAVKLDAGDDQNLSTINHPLSPFKIDTLIKNIQKLDGPISIQSIFFKGMINGFKFDNTDNASLSSWLEKISAIKPKRVIIYTIDRDTALGSLEPTSPDKLLRIADQVNDLGIETFVA